MIPSKICLRNSCILNKAIWNITINFHLSPCTIPSIHLLDVQKRQRKEVLQNTSLKKPTIKPQENYKASVAGRYSNRSISYLRNLSAVSQRSLCINWPTGWTFIDCSSLELLWTKCSLSRRAQTAVQLSM